MAHYLKQPALRERRDVAVELGIGLQMVNILKDALKDSTQGRRYLPPAEGASAAQAEVYAAALQDARQCLQRGLEFVLALPVAARELRSFCGLPISWGAMTLTQAEQDTRQAKIGRGAIQDSITRFDELVGDDAALREWLSGLLNPSRVMFQI
jgi:phytoene/squalene synthetase